LQKLIIAVGSTRRPKLDGVRDAVAEFGPRLDPQSEFEIVGVEAPSGVRDTPLSRAEMMTGARNRAEHLQRIAIERREPWSYFIGVEGGLEIVKDGDARLVFLENWAYVLDRDGRGSFGQSGAVTVPEPLAVRVVDEGIDLACRVSTRGDQCVRAVLQLGSLSRGFGSPGAGEMIRTDFRLI
jgi:non-canonical (house-cleaning) NTP pyrophosphatase